MAEDKSDTPQTEAGSAPQQQFGIQRIYVKDVSFESPQSPGIFRSEDWSPTMDVQMRTHSQQIGDDVHETVLTITVSAKYNDAASYLVEVQQAGIFRMTGFEPEQAKAMLGAYCPNILYPYAREVISDLIVKGGFPPYLLGPVNFDALYMQQMQQEAQEQKAAGEAAH